MEGKESQKDILRLRQLESAKHEHSSTSNSTTFGNINMDTLNESDLVKRKLEAVHEQKQFVSGIPIESLIEGNANETI